VAVSHNPESNMKLASGIAPVPGYLRPHYGWPWHGRAASNNDLDMFEAMRFAALLHKVKTGDRRLFRHPWLWRWQTINGAQCAQGLEKTGSDLLRRGKRADLVIVSAASARLTPM
jgi:5-methylthioadenosine/S-adenosylhomocysteine deaminase